MSGTTVPVRAVISDFGGVLTTPLIQSFLAYQERSGLSLEDLGRAIAAAAKADGGRHPLYELEKGHLTEAEFLKRLEAQLGGPHLRGMRETYFEHLHPNREMIDWVRAARERGMRTALLTNNVREWEPLWRAKLPEIDELFEVVVDSAFVGMRKPEPEIYELTLERLAGGLRPVDCLFIDDVEVNCDAARALGIRTVHFVSNEQAIPELDELCR